jgi:hypothetical protein
MDIIAFWHAFGPHGQESTQKIIKRKRAEINRDEVEGNEENKWTLWSFKYMKSESIVRWIEMINEEKPKQILVLCSAGKNNVDPSSNHNANGDTQPPSARYYKEYIDNKWQEIWQSIPQGINVPHPWGNKEPTATQATAFKVSKILLPSTEDDFQNDWLEPLWRSCKKYNCFSIQDNTWYTKANFQCRNFLIKPSNDEGFTLGPIRALLELKYPYVVQIKR